MELRDALIEELLAPDRPVSKATLVSLGAGQVEYRADFAERIPNGYLDHYGELVRKRGVRFTAETSSAHARLAQLSGWTFLLLAPGKTQPFSVRWTRFRESLEAPRRLDLTGAPQPMSIRGQTLVVRLGTRETEWQDDPLLPDSDVASAPELPFDRFPKAHLKWQAPASSSTLTELSRLYVVQGASKNDVIRHYQDSLRKAGFADADVSEGRLHWAGTPIQGIRAVSISSVPSGALLTGAGISLRTVAEEWPQLIRGLPDFLEFRIIVWFSIPESAQKYRTTG